MSPWPWLIFNRNTALLYGRSSLQLQKNVTRQIVIIIVIVVINTMVLIACYCFQLFFNKAWKFRTCTYVWRPLVLWSNASIRCVAVSRETQTDKTVSCSEKIIWISKFHKLEVQYTSNFRLTNLLRGGIRKHLSTSKKFKNEKKYYSSIKQNYNIKIGKRLWNSKIMNTIKHFIALITKKINMYYWYFWQAV